MKRFSYKILFFYGLLIGLITLVYQIPLPEVQPSVKTQHPIELEQLTLKSLHGFSIKAEKAYVQDHDLHHAILMQVRWFGPRHQGRADRCVLDQALVCTGHVHVRHQDQWELNCDRIDSQPPYHWWNAKGRPLHYRLNSQGTRPKLWLQASRLVYHLKTGALHIPQDRQKHRHVITFIDPLDRLHV